MAVVVLTWLLLNKTRLGLNVRAVTQNRNMAAFNTLRDRLPEARNASDHDLAEAILAL